MVNVPFAPDALASVDTEAKRLGLSRNEWIRRACERQLQAVNRPGFGQPGSAKLRGEVMARQLACTHERTTPFGSYGLVCDDCGMGIDPLPDVG